MKRFVSGTTRACGTFFSAPILVLLLFLASCTDGPDPLPAPDRLHLFESAYAEEAIDRFPPIMSGLLTLKTFVPNLAPSRLPSDLDRLSVRDRKQYFVRALLPHVLFQNAKIREERALISEVVDGIESGTKLSIRKRRAIDGLLKKYRLTSVYAGGNRSPKRLRQLLRRVDVVPVSLAIAQGAIESGWGVSRFAREGNNIFGHWKTDGGQGMVPKKRPEGATFSLAVFPHISAAVEKYFLNLNTHGAYRGFRRMRFEMREQADALDSIRLATTLEDYSVRGHAYVIDLQILIRQNRLSDLDRTVLVCANDTRRVATTLRLGSSATVDRSGRKESWRARA